MVCVFWVYESPGVQVCKEIAYIMHMFVETEIDIKIDIWITSVQTDSLSRQLIFGSK